MAPRTIQYVTFGLLLSLLIGCSDGEAPSRSFEVAAKGVLTADISEDGIYTVIGSVFHGGSLWRNRSDERLFNWNHKQGEYSTLVASDIAPDNSWALTAAEHTLVLWNMADGSAFRYWTSPGQVLSVALSRGGNFALLGLADNTAVLFDVKRGGIQRTFHHGDRVGSVDMSDDGRLALTGSEDGTAVLWDINSGKALQRFKHDDEVQLVRLSPDGSLAMSAAKYDKAVVWRSQDGKVMGEVPLSSEGLRRGLRFTAATFSDDSRYLLTGMPDQTVQLWRLSNMSKIKQWRLPKRKTWQPTSAAVMAVGFAGKKQYLAVASDGFIHYLK